jgi:hypothetical protein
MLELILARFSLLCYYQVDESQEVEDIVDMDPASE